MKWAFWGLRAAFKAGSGLAIQPGATDEGPLCYWHVCAHTQPVFEGLYNVSVITIICIETPEVGWYHEQQTHSICIDQEQPGRTEALSSFVVKEPLMRFYVVFKWDEA